MPIHIYRNTKRRSSDTTTKPTQQETSPSLVTRSHVTSLTKNLSCFLWQLTPSSLALDILDPSSNTSSLTSNPQAYSHPRPPILKPPQCTPNVCASQDQKDSSTWPITIGRLHNHTSSTVTLAFCPNPHSHHNPTTRTYSHNSIRT